MKKKFLNKKTIITLSIILAVIFVPVIILNSRAPVLIVAEEMFPEFYGKERLKNEIFISSLILFRPVKNVLVADDAGDDIISLAISEISSEPLCVLFPLRYARAAKLYHEQNEDISVVIMEGRFLESEKPSFYAVGDETEDYFIYKTDAIDDFYRAGQTAAAIHYFFEDNNRLKDYTKNGEIVVFLGSNIPKARETFNKAVGDFEEINRKEIKNFRKQREKEKEKREKALEKAGTAKGPHPSEQKGVPEREKPPETKKNENSGRIEDNVSALSDEETTEEALLLPEVRFFTAASQYSNTIHLSCVVLIDTGIEYFERNSGIPIVYFSWLNPDFTPNDAVILVNDSPWVQVVKVVGMVAQGAEKGFISSKFFLSGSQKFDKRTLRKIRKTW